MFRDEPINELPAVIYIMNKISVLTLTYNHENYIEECIKSILLQEVDAKVEILVGNDSSTDNTAKILEKIGLFPHNISMKVFNHTENQGVARNFSSLMQEANGEYIAFLDGDDFMFPGKLQAQLSVFKNSSDINLVHHNVSEVNELSYIIKKEKIKRGVSGSINDLLKSCQSGIQSCSIMVRNPNISNWNEIVPADSKIVDLPFLLHSVARGGVYYINKVFSAYRVINTSITRTTNILTFEKNTRFHVRQTLNFEYVPKLYVYTSLSASYIRCAQYEINNGHFRLAFMYINKSARNIAYPSAQLLRTIFNLLKSIVKRFK